jgi:hypothetical protein
LPRVRRARGRQHHKSGDVLAIAKPGGSWVLGEG